MPQIRRPLGALPRAVILRPIPRPHFGRSRWTLGHREIAVRLAVGAERRHLLRQFQALRCD